jgi:hypothetical protein
MSPAIPADLLKAVAAAVPASEVPKLIARWAITLPTLAEHEANIRQQIAEHPDGFMRHAGGQYPHTSPHRPPDAKRHRVADHTIAAHDLTDNPLDARSDGAPS